MGCGKGKTIRMENISAVDKKGGVGRVWLKRDNMKEFLWNDGSLLCLDYGGGNMTLCVLQSPWCRSNRVILLYVS